MKRIPEEDEARIRELAENTTFHCTLFARCTTSCRTNSTMESSLLLKTWKLKV